MTRTSILAPICSIIVLVGSWIAIPTRESAEPLTVAVGVETAREAAWRQDSIWDDGNAEFAAYDVTWPRYGHDRKGRALLIAVKEPWAPDLDVKADTARADGFEALKLNHIRDLPTGIYTYRQMASSFISRDGGQLRKLSVMSAEACGLTTSVMTKGLLRTESYWDTQGSGNTEWPTGAIPEDSLPLILRDYVQGPLPKSVLVFPSLMVGRLPQMLPAKYEISREDSVEWNGEKATRIQLKAGEDSKTFTFRQQLPHVLLEYRDSQGTVYRLAKVERIPYWSMNGPGGEKWLPEGLRKF